MEVLEYRNIKNGGNKMTNNQEAKYKEVQELLGTIGRISSSEENITAIGLVGLNTEDGLEVSVLGSGEREDILKVYRELSKTLTEELLKEHHCPCTVKKIQEASTEGALMAFIETSIGQAMEE